MKRVATRLVTRRVLGCMGAPDTFLLCGFSVDHSCCEFVSLDSTVLVTNINFVARPRALWNGGLFIDID